MRAKRFLVLGVLLLAQLGWVMDRHAERALSPSLREELGGARFQPSACHPREAAHLETSGPERHLHSCTACLHLLRSLGMARSPLPHVAPPDSMPAAAAAQVLVVTREADFCSGPRAPPRLA